MTTEGPTRYRAFQLLRRAGFQVPPLFKLSRNSGNVRFLDSIPVVVYKKAISHCGEDKELLPHDGARKICPGKWASLFIGEMNHPQTIRHLWIGKTRFMLRYESDDVWRSNCGNVNVSIEGRHDNARGIPVILGSSLPYPLMAIDGCVHYGQFYAFDLNVAPGLKNTGVENILSPTDVVTLIKEF